MQHHRSASPGRVRLSALGPALLGWALLFGSQQACSDAGSALDSAPGGDASTGGTGGTVSSGGVPGTGGVAAGGGSEAASGGSAGPGAGGTGGEATFQPCPATGACKILPLGDSITFGVGFDGGYRVELFRLAHQDAHDITFVGSQTPNGPTLVDGVTFPKKHEGVSGQVLDQIAGRVPTPALDEMPHVILLHAGTNDMNSAPSGAETRLGSLLDKLIAVAPDALIVVSNIIPRSYGADIVDAYNAQVPGVVQTRAAAGAHVLFVNRFTGFPQNELSDPVHPNQAGYARMAGKWYGSISSFLH